MLKLYKFAKKLIEHLLLSYLPVCHWANIKLLNSLQLKHSGNGKTKIDSYSDDFTFSPIRELPAVDTQGIKKKYRR